MARRGAKHQSIFRLKLDHVYGATTDRGVEMVLAGCSDLLPEFFRAQGVTCILPRKGYVFAKAVWVPGFQHLRDGAIEQALAALELRPSWMVTLRQAMRFLRIDARREGVVKAIAAAAVETKYARAKPLGFAEWRWGTLADMTAWLESASVPLQRDLGNENLFRGAQDAQAGREVCRAMKERRWWGAAWAFHGHCLHGAGITTLGQRMCVSRG